MRCALRAGGALVDALQAPVDDEHRGHHADGADHDEEIYRERQELADVEIEWELETYRKYPHTV